MRTKRFHIVTLGCSKNIYDSEVLMGQLKANRLNVTHDDEFMGADTIIINTCGFIENAKQESINTILYWADARRKGLVRRVYVTGCLSQRYRNELRHEIPDIDEYFGTNELPRLLKIIGADYKRELLGERLLTTPSHYAYLKISEGCNRKCSFCAIPLMRGRHVSYNIDELVTQAESLARKGVKEIILIAQDLTYYGIDVYGKRKLAELLARLCKIHGIEWIRLHYAYPQGFPKEVLEVMASEEKICRYIDIPFQHISDRILSSMRRGTTKEKINELISLIRHRIPGVAIRTTLITGYPGETQEDFEELKQWIGEIRFERLGVFTYSHEDNTHAYKLNDDVPQTVKQYRADQLMKVQRRISLVNNKKLIGKSLKVLVDRYENNNYVGRTEFDSPDVDNEVLIKSDYLRTGDFVNVKIIGAFDYDLLSILEK